jgi:hypothetical protein
VLRRPLTLSLLLLALISAGCTSESAQLDPRALFKVSQYTGAPLSGPTTQIADWSDPSGAIFVTADVYAIEASSISDMLPLVSESRLIIRAPTDQPLLATADFTTGFRWAVGSLADKVTTNFTSGSLGQSVPVGKCSLAIPPGATAVLTIASPHAQPQPGRTTGVRILLHCPQPSQLEPAIAAAGTLQLSDTDSPPNIAAELAVLSSINLDKSASVAMYIPFEFADPRLKGLLVLFTASKSNPGNPLFQTATTQSVADLTTSAQTASASMEKSLSDLMYWSALQVGVAGLSDPTRRRSSLSYLAARTGANICQDLVLVAGNENLARLTDMVQPALLAAETAGSTAAAQWALDGSALKLMAKLQSDGKLPPALLSVLVRAAGEPAVDEGSVADILQESRDSSDFQVRITAENFNYLEDNSPAARARAFDWLTLHNAAPAGYDPLGSHDDRQAALEKAYDALSASNGAGQ